MQSLYEEFHQLAVQKKQDYAEYRQIRKEKEELLIAKRTVETILNIDRQKEQEKRKRKRKRRTSVKAKATVCTPQRVRIVAAFCFSISVLSTMGKFYSTVLWETIENRVAIIGRWCSKGIGDASPTSKFAKIAPKGKSRNEWTCTGLHCLPICEIMNLVSRIGYT